MLTLQIEDANTIIVLPCLRWLALCKKFHENPSIFMETGYSCTPSKICSLQAIKNKRSK